MSAWLARWMATHLTRDQILWIRRAAMACFVLLVAAFVWVAARA